MTSLGRHQLAIIDHAVDLQVAFLEDRIGGSNDHSPTAQRSRVPRLSAALREVHAEGVICGQFDVFGELEDAPVQEAYRY
jgi:hypothetical protein